MERSKTVDRSSYAGGIAFSLGLGEAGDLARGVSLSLRLGEARDFARGVALSLRLGKARDLSAGLNPNFCPIWLLKTQSLVVM